MFITIQCNYKNYNYNKVLKYVLLLSALTRLRNSGVTLEMQCTYIGGPQLPSRLGIPISVAGYPVRAHVLTSKAGG